MMNDEELIERVRSLVVRQVGCRPEAVVPKARLAQDLGVTGDDGVELMQALSAEFDIDITSLRCRYHFGSEGWLLLPSLLGFLAFVLAVFSCLAYPWLAPPWLVLLAFAIRRSWRLSKADTPATIRVSDLIRAAETGRWDFPYLPENLAV